MKLNERSLAFYATCNTPADNAGFLYKKGGRHAAYHRRWFVLRGNMLFYFEDAASREPVGVIILEGCAVELVEAAEEFAFAVRFAGSRARTYVLVAESQADMEGWVKALSRASFDYLRVVVPSREPGVSRDFWGVSWKTFRMGGREPLQEGHTPSGWKEQEMGAHGGFSTSHPRGQGAGCLGSLICDMG